MIKYVEADSRGPKKRLPLVFEKENRVLVYSKRLGVHNRDHYPENPFHAYLSDTVIQSLRKGLAWDRLLKMVDVDAGSEIRFQHPL